MDAVEYDYYTGDKLTQTQMDIRVDQGWTVAHHNCSADHVHSYTFRRKKQVHEKASRSAGHFPGSVRVQ